MDDIIVHRPTTYCLSIFIAICLLLNSGLVYAKPFSLKQAEAAALHQSPELKSLNAKTNAIGQAAIADSQLGDPKLMLGAMNVPVDTFNFSQEPMTQVQVGLMQKFPRGKSLHYIYLEKNALSEAERQKKRLMRLEILKGVRLSWLRLNYWLGSKRIILKEKIVFRQLLKVAESMLANNLAQQKDVIRAQLELNELDDRLLLVQQHIETSRAELARWIGPKLAKQAWPRRTPTWKPVSRITVLSEDIKHHPIIKVDDELIVSRKAEVKYADQQYHPGMTAGVAYGFRQGRNLDGRKRSDFLTAQVSFNLPLFTRNRQDKLLKASEDNLLAIEKKQLSDYRQLHELLRRQYAAYKQQQKSAWLYIKYLVPQSNQYAEATMTAYQNLKTDFPTLARAYVRELNTEIEGLKTKVDQSTARVYLLYLQDK